MLSVAYVAFVAIICVHRATSMRAKSSGPTKCKPIMAIYLCKEHSKPLAQDLDCINELCKTGKKQCCKFVSGNATASPVEIPQETSEPTTTTTEPEVTPEPETTTTPEMNTTTTTELETTGGALGVRGTLATQRAADRTSVVAMQWSSHWQCWIGANKACADTVLELLPKFLDEYHVDFVNLGLFQLRNPDGQLMDGLPPGVPDYYSTFDLNCNRDNIKILYNSAKWALMPVNGVHLASVVDRDMKHEDNVEQMYGCFNEVQGENGPTSDRVYGIFPFKMKTEPLTIIVVFSHFPHPPGGSSSADNSVPVDKYKTLKDILGTKINLLKNASAAANVLVIADLNLDMPHTEKGVKFASKKAAMPDLFVNEPALSSEEVWEIMKINGSSSLKSATEYELTCCSDKTKAMGNGTLFPPAGQSKFAFAFDRVLANFGTMKTVMPLEEEAVKTQYKTSTDECPMYVGAFHKPIIGDIALTD